MVFKYEAMQSNELTLEVGQVVEVIAVEVEGWWKGRIGSKERLFPSNFVEIIEEDDELPQTTGTPSSMNESDKRE